jgi:hypothetical protein
VLNSFGRRMAKLASRVHYGKDECDAGHAQRVFLFPNADEVRNHVGRSASAAEARAADAMSMPRSKNKRGIVRCGHEVAMAAQDAMSASGPSAGVDGAIMVKTGDGSFTE